jgi:hypothetical protein
LALIPTVNVIEVLIKILFVVDILLSCAAIVPLIVMCVVGSRIIAIIALLGALTVVSFDIFAEEATACAVVNTDWRSPKVVMLMDGNWSPPDRP